MDVFTLSPLFFLGACTGFLAGLLGIGGGMLIVPFLTFFLTQQGIDAALAVKMAIATAMATIVLTSLSSMRKHQQKKAIVWPVVVWMTPGVLVGAALASFGVFRLAPAWLLAWGFALLVGSAALQMLRSAETVQEDQGARPRRWQLTAAGTVVGFLSGLVGAGGGFITVPWLNRQRLGMRRAVACSAALGFPIALFNTLGYVLSGHSDVAHVWGYVWLPGWVMLAAGSVLTAPWGARAAHTLPVDTLKKVFSTVLFSLAGYMAWRGVLLFID